MSAFLLTDQAGVSACANDLCAEITAMLAQHPGVVWLEKVFVPVIRFGYAGRRVLILVVGEEAALSDAARLLMDRARCQDWFAIHVRCMEHVTDLLDALDYAEGTGR